jgi:hypothetical protein
MNTFRRHCERPKGAWQSRPFNIRDCFVAPLLAMTAEMIMLSSSVLATDTQSRLFFSDANISFICPSHWTLQPNFPYGPLFTKTIKDGTTALISCAISAPLEENNVSADISQQVLKQLAKNELEVHQPGYRALSERDRQLAGQNAFEITWEDVVDSQTLKHQSLYFFVEDRIYALTLQSNPHSFRWLVPDYQHWLNSLRILSRKDSGSLEDPAHGGLWIHQTGGVKIAIPEPWLIAVSDDRTLGATFAQGGLHTEITATVDLSSPTSREFSRRDKKDALKAVHKKGLRIVHDSNDPFHGLPAFQVQYEGMLNDRVVKGMDIWVISPKGRWLFNVEGDVSLYNSLADQYEQILKNIEFI